VVRIEVVWPIGHPVLRARCVLSGEQERGKAIESRDTSVWSLSSNMTGHRLPSNA